MPKKHLLSYISQARQHIIDWQTELTRRPALGPENGGQGEDQKAAWLLDWMRQLQLHAIQEISCPDSRVSSATRPNLAARYPGKEKKTLWIIGHMDVVPAGDLSLWKSDPFQVAVEEDCVIGRGVEDNQQAIVTAMLVAQALTACGVVPDLSLGLLFVSDEETGMRYGLPHVLTAAPELIRQDDLVLVPDMGSSRGDMIEIAEKSSLWLKFTVTGRQCHASTPDKGINSLVASSALVLALEQLYRKFRRKNSLFSPSWSTFVPTKKEANVENVNTLPGKDIFYLDCRVLPEYDLNLVLEACRTIAAEVAAGYKVTITVEATHTAVALRQTDPHSEVVTRLSQALERERKITPTLFGSGGQTVALVLRNEGIPAAAWATLMPNAHTPNERSSISNTLADARVVASMLFNQ